MQASCRSRGAGHGHGHGHGHGNGSGGEVDRFSLRCPECGGTAFTVNGDLLCPTEGRRFDARDGLLPLLSAERERALDPFLEAYRRVRRREGWGGPPEYYRSLPMRDASGRHREVWKIRARSYRLLVDALRSHFDGRSLRILELGAGNGWLSWRLAEMGHVVLATDVSGDEEDGLGALARYAPRSVVGERLTAALAALEDLPLEDEQFDAVVAAGSFHYTSDLGRAVTEARRVVRRGGLLLIADSPTYESSEAGRAMIEHRQSDHRERYGVEPTADTTAGFLWCAPFLEHLTREGFRVELRFPFEGARRVLSRVYRRARVLSPPARFPVFVAERLS